MQPDDAAFLKASVELLANGIIWKRAVRPNSFPAFAAPARARSCVWRAFGRAFARHDIEAARSFFSATLSSSERLLAADPDRPLWLADQQILRGALAKLESG